MGMQINGRKIRHSKVLRMGEALRSLGCYFSPISLSSFFASAACGLAA
jgi:hypothetical protein